MPAKGQLVHDRTGQRFGMLTVLELVGRNSHRQAIWRCKCDCGNERSFTDNRLRQGTSTCGCVYEVWPREKTCNADGECNPEWLKMLREQISYDPETGILKWVAARKSVRAGATTGTLSNKRGHLYVHFLGVHYLAHRLIWAYVNGRWPREQIDHINGVKTDNRIANLRDVSHAMNQQNRRKASSASRTGLLGVHRTDSGKYYGHITAGEKRISFPRRDTPEEAYADYLAAKRQLHEGNTL